jgi:signal transduction histidine kinase
VAVAVQVRAVRVPALVVDAALAVSVTGFVVLTELSERRHQEHVPTSGLLILACLAPALAIRRRLPGTALALVTAVQLGVWATGTAPGAHVPAELIAPYSAAVYGSRRVRIACGVLAGAALVAIAIPGWPAGEARGGTLGYLVAGGGAWLVGAVVRARRERMVRLAERADRLERERDRQAREAVAEERLRIARELHDVVAHNLSVVVVQAQALQPVVARDPEQARGLAVSIEETGREALEEMRRLLGVLRASDSGTDDEAGLPGPQPGLDRLDALVEQVRQAGLPVTLTVTGDLGLVPQAVQLSAYRIVQEALTNVLKHAGPATAEVTAGRTDARLVVTVRDDGRGAAANLDRPALPSFGHGLVGMRERVALFGGELAAGPRPGGGYEVRASIPVEAG